MTLSSFRSANSITQSLFIGIAVQSGPHGSLDVGFASHDGTYSIDFAVTSLTITSDRSGASTPAEGPSGTSTPVSQDDLPDFLVDFLITKLSSYQKEHLYKFTGAGINENALRYSPLLAARLWQELDIVTLVMPDDLSPDQMRAERSKHTVLVDEEADSMARKALLYVYPTP